jgi:hypothetical protein
LRAQTVSLLRRLWALFLFGSYNLISIWGIWWVPVYMHIVYRHWENKINLFPFTQLISTHFNSIDRFFIQAVQIYHLVNFIYRMFSSMFTASRAFSYEPGLLGSSPECWDELFMYSYDCFYSYGKFCPTWLRSLHLYSARRDLSPWPAGSFLKQGCLARFSHKLNFIYVNKGHADLTQVSFRVSLEHWWTVNKLLNITELGAQMSVSKYQLPTTWKSCFVIDR